MDNDSGQTSNVIEQFPKVVERIRNEHEIYWEQVTPGDRELARVVVGHPSDPETYLHPSDWYLPTVPWNHAQVARGPSQSGSWHIAVAENGTYRFEVRRWPREAAAPLAGIPDLQKRIDAWDAGGAKPTLIYAGTEPPFEALPVAFVRLEVGPYQMTKAMKGDETAVIFETPLKEQNHTVKAELLNRDKEVIAGGYYVYCSRVERP